MRITQGTFSFLPDLTDAEISAQIEYALKNGWAEAPVRNKTFRDDFKRASPAFRRLN